MRNLCIGLLGVVLAGALAAPASAAGSAVDQFSAVKYIRNLSDLSAQYRDHGLSLQLDGFNYEWLIFSDSAIRDNIQSEIVILGRSNAHIVDPLAWDLHVQMLDSTITQINTITDELATFNFYPNQKDIVERIARKANEGTDVLDSIRDELGRGEERNYANLATEGESIWQIGNDLICLVKDLDYENWTALYSGDLCAGAPCQNSFKLTAACWNCGDDGCNGGCGEPLLKCVEIRGKECSRKTCDGKKCGGCCNY
jgi:hypothetical protein